jgi:uncharacterized protein
MLRFPMSKCGGGSAEAMVKATEGTVHRRAGSASAERFDAFRLADRGDTLAGEIDVTRRERVADRLAQVADPVMVSWQIEGGHDALDRPALTLALQGNVTLVCQRCLQAFTAAIDTRSELLLARDESELARLDAEEAEVLLASAPLDTATLIEDELLLSLPFAPMHPEAQCSAVAVPKGGSGEKGELSAASPFARLAALKKGTGGTFEE